MNKAKRVFEKTRSRFESILSITLRGVQDPYLDGLLSLANELAILTVDTGLKVQLPHGQIGSRDYVAIYGVLRAAPHQIVITQVVAARSPHLLHAARRGVAGVPVTGPDIARSRDADLTLGEPRFLVGSPRYARPS